jgi:hypothetical protein
VVRYCLYRFERDLLLGVRRDIYPTTAFEIYGSNYKNRGKGPLVLRFCSLALRSGPHHCQDAVADLHRLEAFVVCCCPEKKTDDGV